MAGALYKADRADHGLTAKILIDLLPHDLSFSRAPSIDLFNYSSSYLYSSGWTDVSFSYPPSATHDVFPHRVLLRYRCVLDCEHFSFSCPVASFTS